MNRAARSERTGQQAERTSLAWERTALAVLANGAPAALRSLRGVEWPGVAVGVAGLGLAVACAVIGARRPAASAVGSCRWRGGRSPAPVSAAPVGDEPGGDQAGPDAGTGTVTVQAARHRAPRYA